MYGIRPDAIEVTDHDGTVVAHAQSLVWMENALAAGVDGIEHFTGLSCQHKPGPSCVAEEVSQLMTNEGGNFSHLLPRRLASPTITASRGGGTKGGLT